MNHSSPSRAAARGVGSILALVVLLAAVGAVTPGSRLPTTGAGAAPWPAGATATLTSPPAPGTPTPPFTPPPTAPATPTPTPSPPPTPATPTPGCGWQQVALAGSGDLAGIAFHTPTDGWAVGYYNNSGVLQTLTYHWDGAAWTLVPSPNLGSDDNYLYGVAVLASDDAWAVGTGSGATLTLHWDGTAWAIVPSPNVAGYTNILHGVVALASADVWAVGDYESPGPSGTLILHWDGNQWQLVPSPNPGTWHNLLFGVTALAANDVWAVGSYDNNVVDGGTLVVHWDGTTWSLHPGPSYPPDSGPALLAVTAVGPADLWVVGAYFAGQYVDALAAHWDGTQWHVTTTPQGIENELWGVAARQSNDVWAGGYTWNGQIGQYQAWTLHWDGSAWQPQLVPAAGTFATLWAVGLAGPTTWAVGSYATLNALSMPGPHRGRVPPDAAPARADQPLLARYDGPCPTSCPIQYSDVPADSPFYAYIRCLACRGIVSGYSTSPPCAAVPCFLPGASVTRGQTAKFVANAANYQDAIPSTQQTFTDVPPSSPFWLYVERAALHGVISGYSGNPPCTAGVPCFLPSNSVTRSQTAKFVSQAANYADPIPSTQQTFTDVPASNPFWLYVERSYAHGVISGYSTSPPCASAPCFLPGNAVTRGQTSKFIANTFFPYCQTPVR